MPQTTCRRRKLAIALQPDPNSFSFSSPVGSALLSDYQIGIQMEWKEITALDAHPRRGEWESEHLPNTDMGRIWFRMSRWLGKWLPTGTVKRLGPRLREARTRDHAAYGSPFLPSLMHLPLFLRKHFQMDTYRCRRNASWLKLRLAQSADCKLHCDHHQLSVSRMRMSKPTWQFITCKFTPCWIVGSEVKWVGEGGGACIIFASLHQSRASGTKEQRYTLVFT